MDLLIYQEDGDLNLTGLTTKEWEGNVTKMTGFRLNQITTTTQLHAVWINDVIMINDQPVVTQTTGTVDSKDGTVFTGVTLSASSGTWVNGEDVTGPSKLASGTVSAVDPAAKTMSVTGASSLVFQVDDIVEGPVKTLSSAKRYLKFKGEE